MKSFFPHTVTRARVFVEADPDTKKIYSVQVLINTSAGEHEITYDTSKMTRKKALEFLEKTSAATLAFYDCFKAA